MRWQSSAQEAWFQEVIVAHIELVGRSSSHFTRVARIFALGLGVEHDFRPVLDLTALEADQYAGNPALKIPILVDERGPLFGCENICRELVLRSGLERVIMRADVHERALMNAEELTLHMMSTGVALITAKMFDPSAIAPPKLMRSMENCLTRVDHELPALLATLPADRRLSYFEVTLFALLEHLPFRNLLDVSPWPHLGEFARNFAARPSAQATRYRFDAA